MKKNDHAWPEDVFAPRFFEFPAELNSTKETVEKSGSEKQIKLDALKEKIRAFEGITYKGFAKNLVFADGNFLSDLMFVGEAPGEEEDIQGVPFVGKSGQLLSSFLSALHLSRSDYYITNIVNWRPPGNRTPTAEEVALMRPFFIEHILIIRPKILVAVGSVAFKAIVDSGLSITAAQGNFFSVQFSPDFSCRVFVVYHPSYALRVPSKKKDLWLSLLKLKSEISSSL